MNTYSHNFISLDVVSSLVLKHPLLKDLNPEDIIQDAVDVLRLVGATLAYEECSIHKTITEYKVKLPEYNLNIKSVDFVKNDNYIPMLAATDTLHNQISRMRTKDRNKETYTYSINGGMLKTNQKEGEVFIVYDQLKLAEDGLPMIPDSVPLRKAIEFYIKSQKFQVFVDLGKMPQSSADRAEQEYNWYIGKAQSELQGLQNDDDVETFIRQFNRLFPTLKSMSDRNMYEVNREIRYKR